MTTEITEKDLGIAGRIRRSHGRGARVVAAMSKVTREEREELEAAAKRAGKALGEWGRETLLRAAREGQTDRAVFTELIALRLLMNGVLRSIAVGETLTAGQYQQLLAEVKRTKHDAAADVLNQYQPVAQEK
jgi:hypothetical protein